MKVMELLILEYQTKKGQEIDLKYNEDVEPATRPWVVDQIDASVAGQKAGYIKMSYIPKSHLKEYLPSIFNYLSAIKGKSILPHDKKKLHYSKLSKGELISSFEMAHYYAHGERYPESNASTRKYAYDPYLYIYNGKIVNNYSRRELLEIYKDFEQKLIKRFGKDFQKFKDFHIDKPLVDYIEVVKNDDIDFRRQRIGEALYLAGTKWMNSKGMKLYGSGLQSDPAKDTWSFMATKHNIQSDERGKYIQL